MTKLHYVTIKKKLKMNGDCGAVEYPMDFADKINDYFAGQKVSKINTTPTVTTTTDEVHFTYSVTVES